MAEAIKLLIIDDDEVDRLTVLRSLRKANITVTVDMAENGALGLEYILKNTYDCIFMDFRLPDTDGVELLREVRRQGISTPILIVTSQGDERIAADAIRSGASDYISKSLLTPEGVSQSVRNAIKVHEVEKERLATEKALRDSQERLKEAQKLAKLGNWEFNPVTEDLFFSEEAYHIFEVPLSEKIDYQYLTNLVIPEDRESRKNILAEAVKEKKPYKSDYRILLADGRIKYLTTYGTPILDEDGHVKLLVGTIQDISDRINTRNALKESEERYGMLIETMNEGVLHVDNEQNILFANKRFCELMGYNRTEVIGQSFYMFVTSEKSKNLIDEKNKLRQQYISDQYEIELKRKNGEAVCFLIGGSPLTDPEGTVIGSLGTLTDITERKKIEEALTSSEKLFRTLFENAQGFICTHSLEGHILSINRAGAEVAGLQPIDMLTHNLKDFLVSDAQANFDLYLQDIKANKISTGIFQVINNKTNSRHYLLFRNILYQEPGREAYVIGSAQDITERINIEKELTQAKLIAEKSVKIKEQFLANISHEIRTPMNGIIGLTGVLQKMVDEPEQQNYLQAIQSSADKLLVIINDILDFSKIDAGKIEFEETEFNLKTLLKESLNLFEIKAAENNNRLKVIIDSDVPEMVKGDPGKLTQIINNLVGNAVKFTRDGQIKLFTELIKDSEDTVQIEFTVQDNGIGIPEDKLGSIFESFTQASSDTTRKFGGTGLGLTITKRFVELQGGTISVESKPHDGSTFRFKLTFKKAASKNSTTLSTKEIKAIYPMELGKLKILLAEDNQINQLLVKKIMSDWGFDLDTAENGIEALELFNANDYHIILMDMQMPEMDGYEATEYIRKSKSPKSQIPIIALTAHASPGEAAKCIEAGTDSYVSKPFKADVLLTEIATLLRRDPNFIPPAAPPTSATAIPEQSLGINLDYLREMACGDLDFMAEIINMFIGQTPENIAKLQGYVTDRNWPEVKSLAHKMKSSVVMVGIKELEEIFNNLQHYAINSDKQEIVPGLVMRAKTICDAAIKQLKIELKAL